jgi:four helix bundle protein
MKSIEESDVFKLAHALTLKLYEVTASFPKEETFGLVSQMRQAASSVGMNLVEGAMRLNSRPCRKRSAYSGLPSFSFHSSANRCNHE